MCDLSSFIVSTEGGLEELESTLGFDDQVPIINALINIMPFIDGVNGGANNNSNVQVEGGKSDKNTFENIKNSMSKVEEKDKVYEKISSEYDPQYKPALDAVSIIKKFIADKQLIIYGGTAVDYALRLHGDSIYPDEMLDIPDLDFYSPDSVRDAYELATILYEAGYTSARAIPAMYVITMRVDIADNHFLADISYVPPEVFKTLPTREYEGMKIIDPIFQKIDFHYCLSHPFDNPPNEVIFEKWRKYISRFNLMHKYYPTPEHSDVITLKPVKINNYKEACGQMLLTSFGAYAALRKAFVELIGKQPSSILPCEISIVDNMLTFGSVEDNLVFMHYDLAASIKSLNLSKVEFYLAYINIMPKHISGIAAGESDLGDFVHVDIYSSAGKLVSMNEILIDGIMVPICNIQYLLLQFLAFAHTAKNKKIASTYYAYYESTMEMIRLVEEHLKSDPEKAINNVFFPTINTHGDANTSGAYEIAMKRIKADLGEHVDSTPTPKGFYPSKGAPFVPFDYSTSKYFGKNGALTTEDNFFAD